MLTKHKHDDFISASQYNLEELRSIIFRERYPAEQALDELTALSLLLAFTYERKFEDLQRILFDREKENRLRHNAAIGIARMNRAEAEEILINALSIDEPVVFRGVLKGLGYVGSERSLPLLKQVAQRNAGSLRQVAQWAATVIAYRENGSDEFKLALPNYLIIPEGGRLSEIEVKRAGSELLRKAAEDVRQDPLNITFSAEAGWEISCLNNMYVLLLNTSIMQDPSILTRRKIIAGAVLSFASIEEERWYARYYILTHANTAQEGTLFITAGTGQIHYAGTFIQKQDRVEFQLRATALPGVRPVHIEGAIAQQSFRISNAWVAEEFFRRSSPIAGKLPR